MILKTPQTILAGITSTASAGIPEELEQGVTQVIVGIVTYFLTVLFNRLKDGNNKK